MLRLLIIEDDADSRDMLALLLESGGYEVTTVDSETAATRMLRFSGYDLVIADLMLDRMRVEECWDYVARIVDLARPTPVGVLTGWNVPHDAAIARGLAFVLKKPCTRDVLFAQLATTLELPSLSPAAMERARDYFRCIERGTYDQFRSFLAADFVYRLPGADSQFANEVRGLEDFISFTARTFQAFEEPRFDLKSIRPLPHGALVEYVGSWREGTNRRAMPGAVMFELGDGQIQRAEVRMNLDELR